MATIEIGAVKLMTHVIDCDPGDRDRVMAVNINGPWYLARRVLPVMRDRKHGVIINVTSYAGDVGGAGIETPYAVSTGALNTLTRCLAHEAGPFGIRVNIVSPGLAEGTKFILDYPEIRDRSDAHGPLGSLPHKDKIAESIAYLASSRGPHHRKDPQHLRRRLLAQLITAPDGASVIQRQGLNANRISFGPYDHRGYKGDFIVMRQIRDARTCCPSASR